jgi:hypothetical protein
MPPHAAIVSPEGRPEEVEALEAAICDIKLGTYSWRYRRSPKAIATKARSVIVGLVRNP